MKGRGRGPCERDEAGLNRSIAINEGVKPLRNMGIIKANLSNGIRIYSLSDHASCSPICG